MEAGETSLSTRKLVIESAGYNCLSAISAEQALQLARSYPVHAVILDSDIDDVPPTEFLDSLSTICPNIPFYYRLMRLGTPRADQKNQKSFPKNGRPSGDR